MCLPTYNTCLCKYLKIYLQTCDLYTLQETQLLRNGLDYGFLCMIKASML